MTATAEPPVQSKPWVDLDSMIARTPGVRGGRPRLAGTGVSVQCIAGWYRLGLNAEEIAQQYPHLSLGQIYAALTYYHANTAEIEGYLAEEARLAQGPQPA